MKGQASSSYKGAVKFRMWVSCILFFFCSFPFSRKCFGFLLRIIAKFTLCIQITMARPTAQNLVPIRLDLDVDGQKFKDTFTWNPSGRSWIFFIFLNYIFLNLTLAQFAEVNYGFRCVVIDGRPWLRDCGVCEKDSKRLEASSGFHYGHGFCHSGWHFNYVKFSHQSFYWKLNTDSLWPCSLISHRLQTFGRWKAKICTRARGLCQLRLPFIIL